MSESQPLEAVIQVSAELGVDAGADLQALVFTKADALVKVRLGLMLRLKVRMLSQPRLDIGIGTDCVEAQVVFAGAGGDRMTGGLYWYFIHHHGLAASIATEAVVNITAVGTWFLNKNRLRTVPVLNGYFWIGEQVSVMLSPLQSL
jgi:hypothetical protein